MIKSSSSRGWPASLTTSAVMSLVIEAIGIATSERREYSTAALLVSTTNAALERSAGPAEGA